MTTELSTEVRTVENDNPLALLQTVLSDPNTDPEKMDKLFALYERMEAQRARTAYARALAKCKSELPAVVRDKTNSHTRSKYASLEAVADKIDHIIAANGFSLSFTTDKADTADAVRVVAIVRHEEGHSESHHLDCPLDSKGSQGTTNKTGIQAMGSTISYGRRYLKLMIFDVSVADQDNDGNRHSPPISAEQLDTIARLIDETETDLPKFLGWAQVETLADLPAGKFREAMTMLNKKRGGA